MTYNTRHLEALRGVPYDGQHRDVGDKFYASEKDAEYLTRERRKGAFAKEVQEQRQAASAPAPAAPPAPAPAPAPAPTPAPAPAPTPAPAPAPAASRTPALSPADSAAAAEAAVENATSPEQRRSNHPPAEGTAEAGATSRPGPKRRTPAGTTGTPKQEG